MCEINLFVADRSAERRGAVDAREHHAPRQRRRRMPKVRSQPLRVPAPVLPPASPHRAGEVKGRPWGAGGAVVGSAGWGMPWEKELDEDA